MVAWVSTNGLMYMTCGSGVGFCLVTMEVTPSVLREGFFSVDNFNVGGSVLSNKDLDGW